MKHLFATATLIALLPWLVGCQRVAFVTLHNETGQTLIVTDQTRGTSILGEVPPHSARQLEHVLLIQGMQPFSLRIASPNGRIAATLQVAMDVARRSAKNHVPVAITCREGTSPCFFTN